MQQTSTQIGVRRPAGGSSLYSSIHGTNSEPYQHICKQQSPKHSEDVSKPWQRQWQHRFLPSPTTHQQRPVTHFFVFSQIQELNNCCFDSEELWAKLCDVLFCKLWLLVPLSLMMKRLQTGLLTTTCGDLWSALFLQCIKTHYILQVHQLYLETDLS